MIRSLALLDGEQIRSHDNGQDWLVSWHPPAGPPNGTPHGAAGVCLTGDGHIVYISPDGTHWGFPAGRPEGDEGFEETLRREVLEEACARVTTARLLGFGRGECVSGRQRGTVLVRSFWRADVVVDPWEPRYEIRHRRLVPAAETRIRLSEFDLSATRVSHRALDEAGVP